MKMSKIKSMFKTTAALAVLALLCVSSALADTTVREWTALLGTTQDEWANYVVTDSSGNAYMSGQTYGNLDGQTNAGGWDTFIVKYDPAGTKQGNAELRGTATNDIAMGAAMDTANNIYLVGHTFGSMDGNTVLGDWDVILMKYDSSFTNQWTMQTGTDKGDFGYDVSVDTAGNICFTGETRGDFDGNPHEGDKDMYAAKYSPSGAKI
jgi:hypothetical protein